MVVYCLTLEGHAVQCKAYLAQPAELVTGLNLIHTTNLDYFTTQHQAEIFRLKGQFLQVRRRAVDTA